MFITLLACAGGVTRWDLDASMSREEIQAQYDEEVAEFKVFFAPYTEAIKKQIGEENNLYIALLETTEEIDKSKPVDEKELISKIMTCNDYEEYGKLSKAQNIPESCLMSAFLLELFHDNESLFKDFFEKFSNDEVVKAILTNKDKGCSTAYSEIIARAYYLQASVENNIENALDYCKIADRLDSKFTDKVPQLVKRLLQSQYDKESAELKAFFAPYIEAIQKQIGDESNLYIELLETAEESNKSKPADDKDLINKIMACNDSDEYRKLSKSNNLPVGCLMSAFLLELFHDNESLFKYFFEKFSNDEVVKATFTYIDNGCSTAYSEIIARAYYLRALVEHDIEDVLHYYKMVDRLGSKYIDKFQQIVKELLQSQYYKENNIENALSQCRYETSSNSKNGEKFQQIVKELLQSQYYKESKEFKVFFAPYIEAIKKQIDDETNLYIELLETAEESNKSKSVDDKDLINKIIACDDYDKYRELSSTQNIPEGCLTDAFILELFQNKEKLFKSLFIGFEFEEVVKSTFTYKDYDCSTSYSEIIARAYYLRATVEHNIETALHYYSLANCLGYKCQDKIQQLEAAEP